MRNFSKIFTVENKEQDVLSDNVLFTKSGDSLFFCIFGTFIVLTLFEWQSHFVNTLFYGNMVNFSKFIKVSGGRWASLMALFEYSLSFELVEVMINKIWRKNFYSVSTDYPWNERTSKTVEKGTVLNTMKYLKISWIPSNNWDLVTCMRRFETPKYRLVILNLRNSWLFYTSQ